jgi:hypothetical protein
VTYSETEQDDDNERINAAFETLDAFRERFGDIVVFPEVITILDIADTHMNTRHGVMLAKDIYSRAELQAALKTAENSPCADMEEIVYESVKEYRRARQTREEEA